MFNCETYPTHLRGEDQGRGAAEEQTLQILDAQSTRLVRDFGQGTGQVVSKYFGLG